MGATAALAHCACRIAGRADGLCDRRPDTRQAVFERCDTERASSPRCSRGIRRRFAPHQLRHARAGELAREGVPPNIIQRQLSEESTPASAATVGGGRVGVSAESSCPASGPGSSPRLLCSSNPTEDCWEV